jgi:curved DNA-binding protein CbpA
MPDYYEVLQVHPRAESEVIRAAYRVLARKYHPDHGGDPRRMIALNDAWDVLGDPARRAEYDASRARPAAATPPRGAAPTATSPATPAARQGSYSRPATPPPAQAAPNGPAGPRPEARTGTTSWSDVVHAGPPPGRPSGTVLDFGRYTGWSLGEIARYDLDYLDWLQRATVGRSLRPEIDALLVSHRGRSATIPPTGRGWSGRR